MTDTNQKDWGVKTQAIEIICNTMFLCFFLFCFYNLTKCQMLFCEFNKMLFVVYYNSIKYKCIILVIQ